MKKICSALICLGAALLLTSCSNNNRDATVAPEIVKISRVTPYYIAREGDTVGTVAKKHGMTRTELVKMNNLQPPYQLYNGQRLLVSVNFDENAGDVDSDVVVSDNDEKKVSAETETPTTDEAIKTEPGDTQEKPEKEVTIDDANPVEEKKKEEKPKPKNEGYAWPIAGGAGKISKHFVEGDVDGGIVIDASAGTPVRAFADGVVMIAGVPNGDAAAYGLTVVIKHAGKNKMSIYANLKEASVKAHHKVKKGDVIGKVGKSGAIAKKPQLYFEVNDISGKGRKAEDPEKLLSKD